MSRESLGGEAIKVGNWSTVKREGAVQSTSFDILPGA